MFWPILFPGVIADMVVCVWAHVSCPTPRESCHGSTIPAALSTGASTPSINAPSSLELRLNLDFIHSSYGIRLRGELNPDF